MTFVLAWTNSMDDIGYILLFYKPLIFVLQVKILAENIIFWNLFSPLKTM